MTFAHIFVRITGSHVRSKWVYVFRHSSCLVRSIKYYVVDPLWLGMLFGRFGPFLGRFGSILLVS